MNKPEILEKWEKTLSFIENDESYSINATGFETWFRPLVPESVNDDADIIIISAPAELIVTHIKGNYYIQLEDAISRGFDRNLTPVLRVAKKDSENSSAEMPSDISEKEAREARFTNMESEVYSNPKYSFENFIVGDNNRYAHAAALAVAENPSEKHNPLFLYGGSGLGKTHLMHAIGHYILENDPTKEVLYVSSEMFTNELISCIGERDIQKTELFKNKYRNIDVLLIDDIQFLEKKDSTQIEFFHTFEALSAAKKQVVVTADCKPSDLTFLNERLRSRLQSKLVADIQPPDYETRVAILINNAELAKVEVDDEIMKVISIIAESIDNNVRELEGAFERVISFSSMFNEKIDLKFAKNVLSDIFAEIEKNITPEKIISEVADYFNIKPEDIKSSKRNQKIAHPRHIAMYLCRELTELSFPQIGDSFGGRDHTTILHAYNKICSEIEDKDETLKEVEEIREYFK